MNQAASLLAFKDQVKKKKGGLRTIAITSGKGGVGKTNVVVNLGFTLARGNIRVAILDADYGLGNIDILLGIDPKHDISDLFERRAKLEDILIQVEKVNLIPASSGIQSLANISDEQESFLHKELQKLEQLADVLFIDTAAGISDNVISLLLSAEEVFLVVSPEPTSIIDAYAVVKVVSEIDAFKPFAVIANMVRSEKEAQDIFLKLSRAALKFLNKPLEYLGFIQYDKKVVDAVRKQRPLVLEFPKSIAAADFEKIARVVEKKFPGGGMRSAVKK